MDQKPNGCNFAGPTKAEKRERVKQLAIIIKNAEKHLEKLNESRNYIKHQDRLEPCLILGGKTINAPVNDQTSLRVEKIELTPEGLLLPVEKFISLYEDEIISIIKKAEAEIESLIK